MYQTKEKKQQEQNKNLQNLYSTLSHKPKKKVVPPSSSINRKFQTFYSNIYFSFYLFLLSVFPCWYIFIQIYVLLHCTYWIQYFIVRIRRFSCYFFILVIARIFLGYLYRTVSLYSFFIFNFWPIPMTVPDNEHLFFLLCVVIHAVWDYKSMCKLYCFSMLWIFRLNILRFFIIAVSFALWFVQCVMMIRQFNDVVYIFIKCIL